MIPGVLVERMDFESQKHRKKVPKLLKNPPKIDLWALFGILFGDTAELLGRYLGHMLPN